MRPVFLLASVLLFAVRANAAGGIQVAEYSADVDDVSWNVGGQTQDIRSGDVITEPLFSFSPNSIAQLFYSLGQDQALDDSGVGRWGGDSFFQSTGLSQTWYFARRQAEITLGYGFEQSETADLYDDLSAHSVIFNGRFPLFWGLGARLQANYALNSYDDYRGVSGVDSNKKLFQAAINRSFSPHLFGEFQFSYLDEDFDETELSYRRTIWGLNLRYKY